MGIHKYIDSPETMWRFFIEYESKTKSNPFKKHVFVGKDGKGDYEERERCLTIEGFYEYVSDHPETKFNTETPDLSHYFENKDNRYSDFVRICSRIKRRIRKDQIEGGMAGIYNPSITQRLNNLVETTDNKQSGKQEIIIKYESTEMGNSGEIPEL
jgi:hypothetical protein